MNFEKTKLKNKPYSPDIIINDIKNMKTESAAKQLPFYLRFGNSGEWAVHEDDGCLVFHPQWNTSPHQTSKHIWKEAWDFVESQGGFDKLVKWFRDTKIDNKINVNGYIFVGGSSHENQTNEIASEYICEDDFQRIISGDVNEVIIDGVKYKKVTQTITSWRKIS